VIPGPLAGPPLAGQEGNPEQIRDRLGQWLDDEDFAAAFGVRGKPALPVVQSSQAVVKTGKKRSDRW